MTFVQRRIYNPHTTPFAVTVIELWSRLVDDCPMCGEVENLDHVVGYYCGFTRDPIGSITTEYVDGGEVGGMSVCKRCHDRFYAEGAA